MPWPPRAAIVVAAKNAERFLRDAVGSALAQSEPSVEVVVVDDGSTDGTLALARSLAVADPRLRVVSQSNHGPGHARNRGVENTSAPYLVFLDADDWIPEGKVETQAAFLDAHPDVGVVYSDCMTFTGGEPVAERPFGVPPDAAGLARSLTEGGRGGFPPLCGMVRRADFDRIGGFREIRPLLEDRDLWTRLACAGVRFAHLAEPCPRYRIHAGSRNTIDLEVRLGELPILDFLLRQWKSVDPSRADAARTRARYNYVAVSELLGRAGRKAAARRVGIRSLKHARRAGEIVESALLVLRPGRTSFAR
jgi:glycosyltransferase involved in cell wall biosynthesis